MRWQGHKESSNVEDRRAGGPGGRRAGLGLGTIAIAVVAAWLFGVDPRMVMGLLEGVETVTGSSTQQGPAPKPTDETGRFVSVVLASTEETWSQLFAQGGQTYQPPKLVLYSVRIPANLAFERNDIELEIEREGDEIRIRPARRTLAGVLAKFARFAPDFMAEGRGDQEQAEREAL